MKREPWSGYVAALTLAAVVAGLLFMLGKGWADCEDQGGQYVRGVSWYTCVAPADDAGVSR